jgi:putative transposase
MPQSFASLPIHLVFSTKKREPLITGDLPTRLFQYMGGILKMRDSPLLAADGMPDHVQLLVSMSKQLALADLMRELKSSSSKWVHETFPTQRGFGWQTGYGAFAASHSSLPEIKRHIANQAHHHRTRTFQEEFKSLLIKHEIEFDEQYLWD